MPKDLYELQDAVEKQSTAKESAVTLIEGLAQQIRDLPVNQEAITAFAKNLSGMAEALADAVASTHSAHSDPATTAKAPQTK